MFLTRSHLTRLVLLVVLSALPSSASFALASDDPALEADIHDIAIKWEDIKFGVPEGDEQTRRMTALGDDADALAAKYPDRPEAMIWDGIITSERASMNSGFAALGLAKRARAIFEKAYAIDPAVLDAGATTSLGVLYYRVPRWPIAFGDRKKARELLQQAVTLAPEGLDAWYFYGDFLDTQGEYPAARDAFQHALALPEHPDRPLWDKNRRLVIQQDLAKMPQS